ncbi:MAG: adenine deaminase [Bacteroidales bacterium]
MESFRRGWLPDFERRQFYRGEIRFRNGVISEIRELSPDRINDPDPGSDFPVILPGLVDAHVHIESSMLVPSRFSREVVRFGTVATVSDPHEIANVLGVDGVEFMIGDAHKGPAKIFFTAPSCVPATDFETAGAAIEADDLEPLMALNRVVALGEMMNYPGVIHRDPRVMAKLNLAAKYGLPIDGHAPGVSGDALIAYASAGISTDHECVTLAEAEEKIAEGMVILIREGSAARNFDNLAQLISRYPHQVMLCTDDCHPDDLIRHHIDQLIRRGLASGIHLFDLIQAASINPVKHYQLRVGLLQKDDPADFILVSDLKQFRVIETVIDGQTAFALGKPSTTLAPVVPLNRFNAKRIEAINLRIDGHSGLFRVIEAYDGELVTGSGREQMIAMNGEIQADPHRDLLKIAVVNRYQPASPSIAIIRGFGLKRGAMASSIAHDSHQVIAVGTSDQELAKAINLVVTNKGGISICDGDEQLMLPLPVAGLMSADEAGTVAGQYEALNRMAREMGSTLRAPLMTLSFMALLVIPELKIGDRGLFDGKEFRFTNLRIG